MDKKIKKEKDGYKISATIFTNEELERLNHKIGIDLDNIVNQIIDNVYINREMIVFQKVIEKQQKEIEKLKEQLEEERDLNIQTLKTLKECVHKDQIKGIIEKHKKFLLNELSKYEDDDNRKTILFAITRLCFILSDIFKGE